MTLAKTIIILLVMEAIVIALGFWTGGIKVSVQHSPMISATSTEQK